MCDRINFLHSGEIVLDASTSETREEELIRIVKSGLGRQAIALLQLKSGQDRIKRQELTRISPSVLSPK
jgi:simple sugar transport system ATP-binding protein